AGPLPEVRRGPDGGSDPGWRREVCRVLGRRVPPGPRRPQAGGGLRRHAALLLERELQQRLHRDRRRDLPVRALLPALQPATAQSATPPDTRLRRLAALALALRAARTRPLPTSRRAG